MKYIRNDSVNPYYNLALEEYVLKNFTDDSYVLLWQNDHTIVIGKHQNTMSEINEKAVNERGVKVVRRNTGGGAVYHDLGNLNFSYLDNWDGISDLGLDKFLQPVIRTLDKLGVQAEKRGRNDLLIEGRKISGNAQTVQNKRILHHGTLLLNSNLEMMAEVLNVAKDKIETKGIKSVRSRVANIQEYLKKDVSVDDFKTILLETFFESGEIEEVHITSEQNFEILKLQKEKYETWEWNFGRSPQGNFINEERFSGGKLAVEMVINNGLIATCKIWGDFLTLLDISEIEEAMIGVRHESQAIRKTFNQYDLCKYFKDISIEELMECFI